MNGNQEQLSDREKFHWYQNAQNLFWKSPIWEVQTKFDTEFNKKLLDEIYDIGYGIASGQDKKPKDSIWDYDKPNLNIIKQEIIDIVTKTITQQHSTAITQHNNYATQNNTTQRNTTQHNTK